MGAREGTIVGSSLLAICFLVSDASQAMEPVQLGPSMAASSAPALPAFLDDERLPAMQEAWQAHEQAPAAAGGDTTSVRERAEELSRRFSVGATAKPTDNAAPAVATPTGVIPAASSDVGKQTGKQGVMAPVKPVMHARKALANGVEAGTTGSVSAPPQELSAATESALENEKLRLAAPMPPSEAIPPLPKRPPTIRAATEGSSVTNAAITRTAPVHTYRARSNPNSSDSMAALRGTILTNELHAFGWNSQPK